MTLPIVLQLVLSLGVEAQQTANQPAPWSDVKPPAEIAGLSDARPAAPLEFSRAWLRRTESVRLARAELKAAGELDGLAPEAAAARGAALTGTLRVPVIPVRYVDVPEPFPHTALAERLFGEGSADTMSYSGYWREVSGGLLEVTGMVAPWVKLSGSTSHYLSGGQHGWGNFGRIVDFREEALALADSSLDFGEFDNDGPDGIPNSGDDDGYVDFVAFLYALPCPGDGRAGAIWPHRAAMAPYITTDTTAGGEPIRISDYVILPAVDRPTCGPLHVGVLAHETGHALGLPDLYDYDGSTQGIGAWGLMGTGSHAASFSPAHLGAWGKEQLGWVQVDWLKPGSALRLDPVKESRTVKRYDREGSDDYLLFENRQQLGSDSHIPGHGLLAWRVDPERAEVGAWNNDERRAAVKVLPADVNTRIVLGLNATANDPFPGETGQDAFLAALPGGFALSSIEEVEGVITANVAVGYIVPTLLVSPAAVRMTVRADGRPVSHRVSVRAEGGVTEWQPHSRASWLRATKGPGELQLRADPAGLPAGLYADTVDLIGPQGRTLASVPVSLYIAAHGMGQTVATELPWSWGLAVGAGRILQASYGWDPLGLRPRPRVLSLQEGETHPSTLVRLPADALYAPVLHADGNAYVLARTRGSNVLYRIAGNGEAELIVDGIGADPAYGLTVLPDGDLLVAEWSGRLLRVRLEDGRVSEYADLPARVYQIASDGTGVVFAATYDGSVLRVTPGGDADVIRTGFGAGRLVALAVTADGTLFVAERGNEGRIVRIDPNGTQRLVFRRPGAEFYGLAVARDHFIYALDLGARELLRFPLDAISTGTSLADAHED